MKNAFLFAIGKFFVLFFLFLIIAQFVPYGGQFPYKEVLLEYKLPTFLTNLANFDGVHYLLIGRGKYLQYEQAFFPLYPLLIKFLGPLFLKNYLLAGLIISNVCFFFSLFFLTRLLKLLFPKNNLFLSYYFLFLFLFPTAFFFQAFYTESLFMLLFIGSLYFLKTKNYLLAGILAALSSATRLIGVFLFIPFLFDLLSQKPKKSSLISPTPLSLLIASPFLGLFFYMIFLYLTVGDPLYFFNSQPAFGANRSTTIIFLPQVYFRYLKIFFTSSWNLPYFISLVEFFLFNFVLITCLWEFVKNWQKRNYFLLSLAIFSLINILLPSLTGTLSSIPRYALFSISTFFYLASLKNKYWRLGIGAVFLFLQIVLFGLFIQGYFVS